MVEEYKQKGNPIPLYIHKKDVSKFYKVLCEHSHSIDTFHKFMRLTTQMFNIVVVDDDTLTDKMSIMDTEQLCKVICETLKNECKAKGCLTPHLEQIIDEYCT